MICECRSCRNLYEESKSRADLKGFCSQKCMYAKARKLGWKAKGNARVVNNLYTILKAHDAIGSVPYER